MGVQLSLTHERQEVWPITIPQCRPMVVRKNDGKRNVVVVMRVGDSFAWFEADGSHCGITYASGADGVIALRNNYTFIRYLNRDESVTFTGCDF